MTVVMTLVIRDEVDLVDAHLAFHLDAGIDLVLATDHRSVDGTTDILESYEREGVLRLFREDGEKIRQDVWQTRMSRIAAVEHGADWVVTSDADEFWWPHGGRFGDVLSAVPGMYGVLRAYSQSFLPRPGSDYFAERMTVRLASTAPINDPGTAYRPVAKLAYRADPEIVVGWGGHHLSGARLPVLSGWCPIDVLHFPVRSSEQIARKYKNKATAWTRNPRGDLARAKQVLDEGRSDAIYSRLVVSDEAVARGLASGLLVEDTRLRDVLRVLRGPDGLTHSAWGTSAGETHHSNVVARALDVSVLCEADIVRAQRRVDDLAQRVATLERAPSR